MKSPVIGSQVIYQFDDETAGAVNQRILAAEARESQHGRIVIIKEVQRGFLCPAIVVHRYPDDSVNLKLFLDAPFDFWAPSVKPWNGTPGDGCNKWRWPLESQ